MNKLTTMLFLIFGKALNSIVNVFMSLNNVCFIIQGVQVKNIII